MPNNKIIIKLVVGISLLLLVMIIALALYKQKQANQQKLQKASDEQEAFDCANIGEKIGAAGMPQSCCKGLKPMGGWPGGYTGDCSGPPPPGGLNICSDCGNGKCEADNGENKCDCPEDCSTDKLNLTKTETVKILEKEICENKENPIPAIYKKGEVYVCGDFISIYPAIGVVDAPRVMFDKTGKQIAYCGGMRGPVPESEPKECEIECTDAGFLLCSSN